MVVGGGLERLGWKGAVALISGRSGSGVSQVKRNSRVMMKVPGKETEGQEHVLVHLEGILGLFTAVRQVRSLNSAIIE